MAEQLILKGTLEGHVSRLCRRQFERIDARNRATSSSPFWD
jgi:hypothetical protein